MIAFDRSANGRGIMLHIGEVATAVIRWDAFPFGIERDSLSGSLLAGPFMLILYR